MKKRTYWMWVAVCLSLLMSAPAYATETWEIGNIDNSPIGTTTPAAGAFTTLKQTTGAALGAIPISDATGAFTLTASTGTGAPVRATSPTLVTPLLGTPTSGVLTNCTGLPISTGISGLGANVATWLATPSSANLLAAVTDETGTGSAVFATSPTLVTPLLGTPTSGVLTNCTGLPISTGVSGLGSNVATFLATPSSANLASALTDETGTGAVVLATLPSIAGMANTGRLTGFKVNKADEAYNPSALTTDYIVAFTSLTAARACIISTEDENIGTATQPRMMVIKDESGDADSYNITISLESGGTIDGNATYTLNQPYEAVMLYINGTNAFTVPN